MTQSDVVIESNRPFDWLTCKPPLRYHPVCAFESLHTLIKALLITTLKTLWVQSLDDTPEMYKSKQTRQIRLRNGILNYLEEKKESSTAPDWTLHNIEQQISPEDVEFLSAFDFFQNSDFTFSSKNLTIESILPASADNQPNRQC